MQLLEAKFNTPDNARTTHSQWGLPLCTSYSCRSSKKKLLQLLTHTAVLSRAKIPLPEAAIGARKFLLKSNTKDSPSSPLGMSSPRDQHPEVLNNDFDLLGEKKKKCCISTALEGCKDAQSYPESSPGVLDTQ